MAGVDMVAVLRAPLTIAEYAQLGEDDRFRWELQEGSLVMSPSPSPDHMLVSGEVRDQMNKQLPATVVVIQDVDIDLQLDPADQPGTSRRPDLVVVEQSAVQRVRAEGGLLRAAEVLLVIEIVSPGSRRTDYEIKRAEYGSAGIPVYWIIDLQPPVSMRVCRQGGGPGDAGYVDDGSRVVNSYSTEAPFPLTLDLARIARLLA
jgi:Uma2 family endonuclease